MNNSWLCLFMIVENKGGGGGTEPWFERIGLAKFMFPGKDRDRKNLWCLCSVPACRNTFPLRCSPRHVT